METRHALTAAVGATVATLSAAYFLSKSASSTPSNPDSKTNATPAGKTVDQSAITYAAKVLPECCDQHGRMYGGELLKLLDVAAGLVAARHAGGPCLTVSLDRVIFLEEIRVDDVVHISSAVNRAWNTSMEIGVRVMREPAGDASARSYAGHAYLTFVRSNSVLPPGYAQSSLFGSLFDGLGLSRNKATKKPTVPDVIPTSTLEHKRFLLAGRRRAMRIQNKKKVEVQHAAAREQLLVIEKQMRDAERAIPPGHTREETEKVIEAIQREMLVEAYMKEDPILTIDEASGYVEAKIEGFMDPVRMSLVEIKRASQQKGHGGYRRLSVRMESETSVTRRDSKEQSKNTQHYLTSSKDASYVYLHETIVMCMWILRPQWTNSKQNIMFGGALMHDIEQAASIAARRLFPGPWSSAAIDSLSFFSPVRLGEAIFIRACVLRVWNSSVEVFCVVHAEDRNSAKPTVRLVSEAFFSLVSFETLSFIA